MTVGKKLRFEVLKRDSFKCRYCGRTEADGVKLHVDHVIPKALGGRNDPDNLAAACADCNLGKSAAMLNDPRIIGIDFTKRKKVFETARASLERYREYIKAKDAWEDDLISELIHPLKQAFGDEAVFCLAETDGFWRFGVDLTAASFPPGWDEGMISTQWDSIRVAETRLRKSVLYFFQNLGPEGVRTAATVAAQKYVLSGGDTSPQDAFRYFCGICHTRIREKGSQHAR